MIGVALMTMAVAVDTLLLMAAGLLSGSSMQFTKALLGGLVSGAIGTGSLWLDSGFDGLRIVGLLIGCFLAFGFTALKVLIFLGLHISVTALTQGQWLASLLGLGSVAALCILSGNTRDRIPIELSYKGQTLHIIAMRDTGNQLRDPITGRQVLIIGADIAGKLTGLTPDALADPVNTMGSIPGLRLIPYQTVGNTGFLLAMKLTNVKVGNRQGSAVVAFSPRVLGSNYQALTGGAL